MVKAVRKPCCEGGDPLRNGGIHSTQNTRGCIGGTEAKPSGGGERSVARAGQGHNRDKLGNTGVRQRPRLQLVGVQADSVNLGKK